MKKKIEEINKKLLEEKEKIEKELGNFADENKKVSGDWETRFPVSSGEVGDSAMEVAADNVEEYATLLPIEETLETKLAEINLALKKIDKGEKGEYGICEKCGKNISPERLEIRPESRFCLKCKVSK
ncbi:hypothetical protein BWK69_00080 [Candidatus Parcubacteria bacterium A4]|nr:MAG: hypothetical protein BWK69_00080 [Candidatus Parcubacteria bacterium A4]